MKKYTRFFFPLKQLKQLKGVGDIVLVPKIGTLRIDFEGDEYYIAQDREVLAVVNKESNQED